VQNLKNNEIAVIFEKAMFDAVAKKGNFTSPFFYSRFRYTFARCSAGSGESM